MNTIHAEVLTSEIAHAKALLQAGRPGEAMPHLERAHVLGQRFTGPHAAVHWLMFRVYVAARRPGAALGQLVRVALGLFGNAVGVLPVGNTGGSDVNMFRKMPIPADLAAVMEGAHE